MNSITPQEHVQFTILYCTADLMLGSPIDSTARTLGLTAYQVKTTADLLSRLSQYHRRCALVVDLEAGPIALELVQSITATQGSMPVRTIAFGPHVNREAFQAALAAGADRVMPRGQFVTNLPAILGELAGLDFSQCQTRPVADDEG